MITITVYMILSLVLISFSLTLWYFKKEMNAKMQYRDFMLDAEDGIFNDFASNNDYAFDSTKGIAVYKNERGQYKIVSQSKLYNTSIKI